MFQHADEAFNIILVYISVSLLHSSHVLCFFFGGDYQHFVTCQPCFYPGPFLKCSIVQSQQFQSPQKANANLITSYPLKSASAV